MIKENYKIIESIYYSEITLNDAAKLLVKALAISRLHTDCMEIHRFINESHNF